MGEHSIPASSLWSEGSLRGRPEEGWGMTMPFSFNRKDLLLSDFWSLALGGYQMAEAGGGRCGRRA